MPSLDEALDSSSGRFFRGSLRLGAGLGFVLAGATMGALGLLEVLPNLAVDAGLSEGLATRVALVVAGSVVPLAIAAVGTFLSGKHGVWPRRAGLVLVAGSLFVVLTEPGTTAVNPASLPAFVLGVYLLGVLATFVGTLATGMSATGGFSTPGATDASVSYRRTTSSNRTMPADGGRDEDENLDFLLDDEDEE